MCGSSVATLEMPNLMLNANAPVAVVRYPIARLLMPELPVMMAVPDGLTTSSEMSAGWNVMVSSTWFSVVRLGAGAAAGHVAMVVTVPTLFDHTAVTLPAPSTPVSAVSGEPESPIAAGVDQAPPAGRRASKTRPPPASSHQTAAASPDAPMEMRGVSHALKAASEIGTGPCHTAAPAPGAAISATIAVARMTRSRPISTPLPLRRRGQ